MNYYCFAIACGLYATKADVETLVEQNKFTETSSFEEAEFIDFVASDIWKHERALFDECSEAILAVWLKGDMSTIRFYRCERVLSCYNALRLSDDEE